MSELHPEHNTPAARALRAIQTLDELLPTAEHRRYIIEAEDALGWILGLDCTADDPRDTPHLSHNGETCPIHEWLVPADQLAANAERRGTYTVRRFYRDDRPAETIATGLTLQQAQAHCQRADTRGPDWFDGYDEEPRP